MLASIRDRDAAITLAGGTRHDPDPGRVGCRGPRATRGCLDLNVALSPDAATVAAVGVTVKRHSAASWTMSALVVLTSMVARRAAGALFAATRYAIEPSPWPLLAEVSTIHCAVFDAAQVQSRAALTVSDPEPPLAGILSSELVTVTPQRV